jgi:hypothetical protein
MVYGGADPLALLHGWPRKQTPTARSAPSAPSPLTLSGQKRGAKVWMGLVSRPVCSAWVALAKA